MAYRTVVIELQNASVAYATVVRSLRRGKRHAELSPSSTHTSGLISPHRLHFEIDAFVTFSSSVHRTPVNVLFLADLRFLAHSRPDPRGRGASETNPGGTVHT